MKLEIDVDLDKVRAAAVTQATATIVKRLTSGTYSMERDITNKAYMDIRAAVCKQATEMVTPELIQTCVRQYLIEATEDWIEKRLQVTLREAIRAELREQMYERDC